MSERKTIVLSDRERLTLLELAGEALQARRAAAVAKAGSEQIGSEAAAALTELGQVLKKLRDA